MCGCGCGTFPEGPQGVQGPAGLDGVTITYKANEAAANPATPNTGDVVIVQDTGNHYQWNGASWVAKVKDLGWVSGTEDSIAFYGGGVGKTSAATVTVRYRVHNDTLFYYIKIVKQFNNTTDVPVECNAVTVDLSTILAPFNNLTSGFHTTGVYSTNSSTTSNWYYRFNGGKVLEIGSGVGGSLLDPDIAYDALTDVTWELNGMSEISWI